MNRRRNTERQKATPSTYLSPLNPIQSKEQGEAHCEYHELRKEEENKQMIYE